MSMISLLLHEFSESDNYRIYVTCLYHKGFFTDLIPHGISPLLQPCLIQGCIASCSNIERP